MENIKNAIRILNEGGIVIFPTDTAFGVGCRIDNQDAVEKLFKIRKRPLGQAVPVLVKDANMAQYYLQSIPEKVKRELMDRYWPGALTIVLPCRVENVFKLVRGGGNSLGVRMPDHETALFLIGGAGVPILGPSANFHGGKTPYRFEDLDRNFVKMVDYVVPGECSLKNASTVIDCSKNEWRTIRKGAITINL